jgi:hypothetical protein
LGWTQAEQTPVELSEAQKGTAVTQAPSLSVYPMGQVMQTSLSPTITPLVHDAETSVGPLHFQLVVSNPSLSLQSEQDRSALL